MKTLVASALLGCTLASSAWADNPVTQTTQGLVGTLGLHPQLFPFGTFWQGSTNTFSVQLALANANAVFYIGLSEQNVAFKGGVLGPNLDVVFAYTVGPFGSYSADITFPPALTPGSYLWFQTWVEDPNAVQGLSASPTQRVEVQTVGSIAGLFAPPDETTTLNRPISVAVADMDEDGERDLVLGHSSGGVSLALNNGDDTFAAPTVVVSASGTDFVASAELDGDGFADLLVIDGAGVLRVLTGNGDGSFDAPATVSTGGRAVHLVTEDMDGDGELDLVVAHQAVGGTGEIAVLLGVGDGTFGSPDETSVSADPLSVFTGDLDGDGDPDVLAAAEDVLVLLGDGAGGLGSPASVSATDAVAVQLADMDDDGDLDLLVGGDGLDLRLGNGDGTFGSATNYAVGDVRGLVTGLLDTTPLPDIVYINGDDEIGFLLGSGGSTLQGPSLYSLLGGSGWSAEAITLANVAGTGARDVVVAGGNDDVAVLVNCKPF